VTVERTRKTLVLEGFPTALQRKAREHPPVPRKLDGSGEAQLIALACSEPPVGHSQWTLPLYADEWVELWIVDTMSRDTVRRTLKNALKDSLRPVPRRTESSCDTDRTAPPSLPLPGRLPRRFTTYSR
jgi:hypothetical protein